MLNRFKDHIITNIDKYMEIVIDLYEHPEIGKQEYHAQEVLCRLCVDNGFVVEKAIALKTDFIALAKVDEAIGTIAFLCEYDALPEVGHGCGHNLISAISIAAALALKELGQDLKYNIEIIGTPAEENFGGKIALNKCGAFDHVDLALMVHPSQENLSAGRTLALQPLQFEFFGKPAHACRPEMGVSALDCAVTTFNSINMLRQFTAPYTFIHGVIKKGGEAANVIPAYACLQYYFRGVGMDYVLGISEKATKIAKEAAAMFGAEVSISVYETPYEDCQINYTLAKAYQDSCIDLGRKDTLLVDEIPSGSSDIGCVSYKCPTLHGYIKICEDDVRSHSIEMAKSTISADGQKGLIDAASALANIAHKFISNAAFKEEVVNEFMASKKG